MIIFSEKLIVTHLVMKFSAFYGTKMSPYSQQPAIGSYSE